MVKFIKPNLPTMPDNVKQALEEDVTKALNNDEDLGWNRSDSYNFRTVEIDNKTVRSCRTHHSHLSETVENWIKENVVPHWLYATLAVTHPVSDLHAMHTDRTRRYLLIYMIDTGGDNVVSKLYKEKGQPLHRHVDNTNQVLITDYAEHKFEVLDESRVQPGEWVMFDTKVLHDVMNIQRERIAVHISIDSNFDFDKWEYTDAEGHFNGEDFYKAL